MPSFSLSTGVLGVYEVFDEKSCSQSSSSLIGEKNSRFLLLGVLVVLYCADVVVVGVVVVPGSFIPTRILAASKSWACWCFESNNFLVTFHSGVCSHRCFANDEMCLYPLPHDSHFNSSLSLPVSPSLILRTTKSLDNDWSAPCPVYECVDGFA